MKELLARSLKEALICLNDIVKDTTGQSYQVRACQQILGEETLEWILYI